MNPFYAYLYRLRFIRRWGLMQSAVPENVAEHSFHVALLTHALCTIAVRVFGKEVPVERAVMLALYHDATEVITGDIPSPVKHHNRTILKGISGAGGFGRGAFVRDGARGAPGIVPALSSGPGSGAAPLGEGSRFAGRLSEMCHRERGG